MHNRYNLISLFTIYLLGVDMLLLGVGGQLYDDATRYGSEMSTEDFWISSSFILLGILLLTLSIAFLLRQKWARVGLNFFYLLAGLVWTAILIFVLMQPFGADTPWLVLLGTSALVYGNLIFGVLFINNQFVLRQFQDEFQHKAELPDILDA